MKKLIYILCVLLLVCSCHKKKDIDPDPYNLNFEKTSTLFGNLQNWESTQMSFGTRIDTFDYKSGHSSFVIENNFSSSCWPLLYTQSIALPMKAEDVEISFWNMNSDTSALGYFRAILLDYQGNVIRTDSIPLINDGFWKLNTIKLHGEEASLLNLQFAIFPQKRSVWINGLKILLNGKDLQQLPPLNEFNYSTKELSSKQISTSSQTELPPTSWSCLLGKKIVGIGQSVRWQHEMEIKKNELIKYLVNNNHCKLIILNFPELFVEKFNNYIRGEIPKDSIFSLQYYTNYPEMQDLVCWLREYNDTTTSKITIAGVDISNYEGALHDIIRPYNDSILNGTFYYDYKYASNLLRLNKNHLIKLLGMDKYIKFNKLCEGYFQVEEWSSSGCDERLHEKLIFENSVKLINKYCSKNETAVVSAHLIHINKSTIYGNYSMPSLGSYLANYYHDNYYVIAQLVGSGSFTSYQNSPHKNINPLEAPVNRSLEKLCKKMKLNDCLLELKNLPLKQKQIYFVRMQDFEYRNNQFCPQQLQGGIDAITYTEHGTPTQFFQDLAKRRKK